eukprot:TRINITY_DN5543_c0_g1_i1.p1 TRINITY_DN5543_c0_g1~~TRINITY_DN5543_c0_g1_i1.p1  ORF type:complete len:485 (+),score=201.31 TRINITY_DN5543_c0_g1_i1:59-1513(+)
MSLFNSYFSFMSNETQNSDEEIKDPDLASFEIVDRVTQNENCLIAFVNVKSGGGYGKTILEEFSRQTLIAETFDLQESPEITLEKFRFIRNLRIIVCGGDGTVRWILETLHKLNFEIKPAVAVLPLGTGNDIARVLGWGSGTILPQISTFLSDVIIANPVELDRWSVSFKTIDQFGEPKIVNTIMNNYFSIGFTDAKIALDFHKLREEAPHLCTSRVANKFWYFSYGFKTFFEDIVSNGGTLSNFISIQVNGINIQLPNDIKGLLLVNLPSFGGGMDVWGPVKEPQFKYLSFCDGVFELVGIQDAAHLGTVATGLSYGIRIAQGSKLLIKFQINNAPLPLQIDGEPSLQQESCEITISKLEPNLLLAKQPYGPTLASIGTCNKAGYLKIYSGFRWRQRQRYVILHNLNIYIYLNQTLQPPVSIIKIAVNEEGIQTSSTLVYQNCFSVKSEKSEIFYFATQTEQELNSWVNVLIANIQAEKNGML